jgi:hypothetical protein
MYDSISLHQAIQNYRRLKYYMRCINKTVLLQQLSACPSNEISENRMHFWLTMFGHEVAYPETENEENSVSKEEILEGENTNEEVYDED